MGFVVKWGVLFEGVLGNWDFIFERRENNDKVYPFVAFNVTYVSKLSSVRRTMT